MGLGVVWLLGISLLSASSAPIDERESLNLVQVMASPPKNGELVPQEKSFEEKIEEDIKLHGRPTHFIKGSQRPYRTPQLASSVHIQSSFSSNAPRTSFPFKDVVYINLDARVDRRESMEAQLSRFTQTFHRQSAFKLQSLDKAPEVANDNLVYQELIVGKPLTKWLSKRGPETKTFVASVFVSHLCIMEDILKRTANATGPELDEDYLILEDDAVLREGWAEMYLERKKAVPEDWDLLRLGTWGHIRPADRINNYVAKAVAPFKDHGLFYYSGMHAVVVRPRTLGNVIQYLKSQPLTDIDEMVTTCCAELKSYVLTETLVDVWDTSGDYSDHPKEPKSPKNKLP